MKIALLTAIASLAHIGVYLLVRQADIISHSANVNIFWIAIGLTFAYSFFATFNQSAATGNR
jgi:multisubunit Na+/H+ antiporter MnhC subunit